MRALLDTNILVSGLFFQGPERRLLVLALRGRFTPILAQDSVEEIQRVVLRKFQRDPRLPRAMTLLAAILAKTEVVPRERYAARVKEALGLVRDAKDAPILAAALAAQVEALISGDRDLHELRAPVPFPVWRTRAILERLEH